MAKGVTGYIKLQIPAGKATPAPAVQLSDNIDKMSLQSSLMQNSRSGDIPVVISLNEALVHS